MKLYNINGKHVATHQQWPLEGQGVLFLAHDGNPSDRYFTEEGKIVFPQYDLKFKRVVYAPEWGYNPRTNKYGWISRIEERRR